MLSLVILATMLALFTVLLVRRGRDSTAGETLANYLNALISGRTEEAYQLLSAAARARKSQAEYRTLRSLESGLVAGLIAPNVSFTAVHQDLSFDPSFFSLSGSNISRRHSSRPYR